MTVLELNGRPTTDFSDPNRKVKWHKKDVYGDEVYGGVRTIAHLDWTNEQSKKEFGVEVEVLQGAFNTDVKASAGTHDYDGCLDYFIPGVDWWDQQWFFRRYGWACWYRYPPAFGRHCHGISLGCTGRVGIYVPGQIADYRAHKTGLVGHAADDTRHPENIDSTIFDFRRWVQKLEDDMPLNRDDKQFINDAVAKASEKAAKAAVDGFLARKIEVKKPGGKTVKISIEQAIKQAANAPAVMRALAESLSEEIDELTP